jgi:glycosyltransferase involved in cell wall biosynthesis
VQRIPGLRTLLRAVLIWPRLWAAARRVDVVHVLAASWLYFFMAVYPAVLVGRLCGRRVVLNYRGGEAAAFFKRFGMLTAPVFRLATVTTAPSEFLAGVIERRFGVRVTIVPNILDSSLFTYRERPSFRPTLLVTRHLEKIYDIETVLRAFRELQRRYPAASLWIAGGGSEKERLVQLAGEWGLQHVRFLGEIAHRDLPHIYDQCDIYVNASRVDNFPGALLEASAAGLLVVSTRAGGIPYIYTDKQSALLVEPGDWQALANAVDEGLSDPTSATRLTHAALSIVRSCDWPEVRKRLFAAYGWSNAALVAGNSRLDGGACVVG